MLWDLNDSKHLYSLDAGNEIHSLVFSPNRYWLCAAAGSVIKIFDLETKSIVEELKVEFVGVGKKSLEPQVTCLAWSADGQTLFSGYTDGIIRVSHALHLANCVEAYKSRCGVWSKRHGDLVAQNYSIEHPLNVSSGIKLSCGDR